MNTLFAAILAQTNVPPTLPDPLHTTIPMFWTLAIAVVTPIIIAGVKVVTPKIPKVLLPSATPFVGILLGLVLNWLGSVNLSWVDMAQAGALGVAIREIWNNAVTKRLNPSPPPG